MLHKFNLLPYYSLNFLLSWPRSCSWSWELINKYFSKKLDRSGTATMWIISPSHKKGRWEVCRTDSQKWLIPTPSLAIDIFDSFSRFINLKPANISFCKFFHNRRIRVDGRALAVGCDCTQRSRCAVRLGKGKSLTVTWGRFCLGRLCRVMD